MCSTIYILGVFVHALTFAQFIKYIDQFIKQNRKILISSSNVRAINLAFKEEWFKDFLNGANLNYCDGFGIELGARILGKRLPGRITFADAMWPFAEFCQKQGYSLFLLGAKPGVVDRAVENLLKRYPKLIIAGSHHGYFDKTLNSVENSQIIELINSSKANILMVGFGMPIQEQWLKENWDQLQVNVAMCEGALFDFISGEVPRAPRWMTDHGLEWLGRLLLEPRRMWRRYLLGNPTFLWRVLMQRLGVIKC